MCCSCEGDQMMMLLCHSTVCIPSNQTGLDSRLSNQAELSPFSCICKQKLLGFFREKYQNYCDKIRKITEKQAFHFLWKWPSARQADMLEKGMSGHYLERWPMISTSLLEHFAADCCYRSSILFQCKYSYYTWISTYIWPLQPALKKTNHFY